MNALPVIGACLLVLADPVLAAECKVNGQWYPYSSPMCSGTPKTPSTPTRPAPNESRVVVVPASWSDHRPAALAYCQGKYDSYTMQNGCLIMEEKGFKAMQGTYGMPASVAQTAKARCLDKYQNWSMRNGCMLMESKSYLKLHGQ